MFSAGDSSGEGINSLNHFTNMHGSVDWAVLAQQWIQMRDTNTNLVGMPAAPPPPNISCTFNELNTDNDTVAPATIATKKATFEEKGEADMDMDEDDENMKREDSPPPPAPSMHISKTRDKTMQQQPPPWFMQQQRVIPSIANTPGAELDLESGSAQTAIAAPPWNANVWPPPITLPPPTAILPTAQLAVPAGNPTAHIPSLMKINVPNPNTMKTIPVNTDDQSSSTVSMDAAKRKILPAWIREGLEKMEREKQKQLERQQQQSSNRETIDGTEFVQSKLAQTVKTNNTTILESESSGNEDDETEPTVAMRLAQKVAADEEPDGVSGAEIETDAENDAVQQSYVGKRSYEERLSDLMIVVRTTLTELLLEVTNEEISSIAHEAVNSRKAKASSAQVIRKSALTSITSKLGLAAYDDSTSDDSSGSENEATADNDHNNDSEEDIKTTIRLKRRAFAKTSDEIEERIAASAAREEQKLKYYTQMEREDQHDGLQNDDFEELSYIGRTKGASTSNSTTPATTVSKAYERDFGETTETILQHSNGKRQKERISRKERTTRFSDNKDSKSATIAAAAAATYISQIQSSGSGNVSNTNQNAPSSLYPSASTSAVTSPTESSNIYNMPASLSDGTAAISKSLLNAAEAAFDKVTKSKSSASTSSSSEKHHRSRQDREHNRERERERDRERERIRHQERKRERERERERRHSSHRSHERYSSDDEKSSSSSSSESSSSASNSSEYSKYSRTSSTKYQRTEHNRGNSSRKRSRSRSHDRRKHRSDDYDDNNGHYHHSSSRYSTRPSSKKRSRSRSRSTYSASSRKRRN